MAAPRPLCVVGEERAGIRRASKFRAIVEIEGRKQPLYFRLRDEKPFAFAGIWDKWVGPDALPIETLSVVTTEPNELLQPIHDRMPAILRLEDYKQWLDTDVKDPDSLLKLLTTYPEAEMVAYPVSPHVNSPKFDDTECIRPVHEPKVVEHLRSLFLGYNGDGLLLEPLAN